VVVNQVGGKLSDSIGRKPFFLLGPVCQMACGLACFTKPDSARVLAITKVLRGIFTTFSGTVMTSAAMRDTFKGQELGVKYAKIGGYVGLAIMVGPLVEGLILKRASKGMERIAFLALAVVGVLNAIIASTRLPESLTKCKRVDFDLMSTVASANPFSAFRIFTEGNPALKKLMTVATLQSVVDGKSMSDFSMIWMREHLGLSVSGIRNYLISYGFAQILTGAKLTPGLLKTMSVSGFTNLTNFTNFLGFALRGLAEKPLFFFGTIPIMLPGVNGNSAAALWGPISSHLVASGFGVGESSAWTSNLRVLAGAAAVMAYGYCYAFLRKVGINPGYTYLLAGILGAALPQAIFSAVVKDSELEMEKGKETPAAAK